MISDELFAEVISEISKGNYWIAYSQGQYFLEKGDMAFFKNESEARQYAFDNHSDLDSFKVVNADSITSLLQHLPYGEQLGNELLIKEKELQFVESLFETFDWNTAFYDPLHDIIEADTQMDKEDLQRMEFLVDEWERLYHTNHEAALTMAAKYWEGKPMESYKNDFLTIQFDLMIEKNLDYLKSNVRNHGFGETLGPELEAQLQKGQAEFTLSHKAEVNKHEMEATLYFKKSDKTDMYFFNKYDTRLKNEKDETVAQTFYINNGWGVTLKEAYNLLNGRAVHKELTNKEDQKYKTWIQLDFSAKDKNGNFERKQYHENYGYDLKEALSYYFIKEMVKEKDMEALIKSLERGNLQMVNVKAPSGDVRVFIEANPQYKSINVYDSNMHRLNQDQRQELMNKPELRNEKDQSKDKSKDKGLGAEEQGEKKSNKGKKNDKVNGQENGLVQKKRTGGKKGLGV